MIEVSVSDTGPGFHEDVKSNLFQTFFTTKETGMGVGLSISRSIIEAHGGRMWAESNPAGGATFRFTLPAAAQRGPRPMPRRGNVYVIDDDQAMRDSLDFLLGSADFEVTLFESALDFLDEHAGPAVRLHRLRRADARHRRHGLAEAAEGRPQHGCRC